MHIQMLIIINKHIYIFFSNLMYYLIKFRDTSELSTYIAYDIQCSIHFRFIEHTLLVIAVRQSVVFIYTGSNKNHSVRAPQHSANWLARMYPYERKAIQFHYNRPVLCI